MTKTCTSCEQEKSLEEFSNLARSSDGKEFGIADAMRKSMSLRRVMAEIAKCELVCANCHRIRTYLRAQSVQEVAI
jgi:hypothetical protein